MDNSNNTTDDKGGYYNNLNNLKNEKNLKNSVSPLSLCSTSSESKNKAKDQLVSKTLNSSSAPTSFNDMIMRAPVHFWDNGEKARRRYKLSMTINLKGGTSPEFVANMSKDYQSFKRYIPEECYDEVLDWATHVRRELKSQGINPYMGKLRPKLRKDGKGKTQIEPYTAVLVYWDKEEKSWGCYIKFRDFEEHLDLFQIDLTAKQLHSGCKGWALYRNPKYLKKQVSWFDKHFGVD